MRMRSPQSRPMITRDGGCWEVGSEIVVNLSGIESVERVQAIRWPATIARWREGNLSQSPFESGFGLRFLQEEAIVGTMRPVGFNTPFGTNSPVGSHIGVGRTASRSHAIPWLRRRSQPNAGPRGSGGSLFSL